MPTAGKATAAVLFAALSWVVALVLVPLLPPGTSGGAIGSVAALFGALLGWRIVGARAGGGLAAAAGLGLTAAAGIVFWSLFFWSGRQMLIRSIRRRYDDPVDALTDMAALMLDYGAILLNAPVLAVLTVGGVLAGWATELVVRRFP